VFAFEMRDLGAEPVDLGLVVPNDGHARFHTSQQPDDGRPAIRQGEGVRVQVAERGELFFEGHTLSESCFPR
jgi:hypothetical protein